MRTIFLSPISNLKAHPWTKSSRSAARKLLQRLAAAGLWIGVAASLVPPAAHAQGSRKDDIVFGPSGHPVAGATVRVCQATATGTPCAPLATIYTDATLTVSATNPLQTDGIGNYHFYAPAGRYFLQITGTGITGTLNYPDVILPPDVSSSGSGNDISAFGLTLGGNLSVAGNASVGGALTAGTLAPSALAVSGSASIGGPRPYIDVTAAPYGAKGDGATNDTAAITAAINAACNATGTGGATPSVIFPPGTYVLAQPQNPSTSAVLPSCGGLHLLGMGARVGSGAQFSQAPNAELIVNIPGSNPNGMPAFEFDYPNNGTTIENLTIQGYNRAIGTNGASYTTLKNVALSVGSTGLADNTPLKITNQIWFWYKGGSIQTTNSATLPTVLLTGEATASGYPGTVILEFSDLIMVGGPVHYSQRANESQAPPGNWIFHNITREASATDFLYITNDTGNPGGTALPLVTQITFDHVGDSDSTGGSTPAMINLNSSGTVLSGVVMNHVYAGINGPAIRITAGSLNTASITSCQIVCVDRVVDGSNNPISGATIQNTNGTDFFASASDAGSLSSDGANTNPLAAGLGLYGPPARFTPSGTNFSTVAINPSQGFLFNGGSGFGYGASFKPGANAGSIDVNFATAFPPTSVTGTATTGGTLAAGTYYYFVAPALVNGSCSSMSAPSLASNGVVVSTPNNAVSLSWTLPPYSPTATVYGYCVLRSTSPSAGAAWNPAGQYYGAYVSGAGTAGYTDTGFTSCCTGPGVYAVYPSYAASHRFTPTSLGLNTTNPQFNLDVNGSAAVNSLNGVQKAERFSGSDAAAQVNACLAIASTTSGVCDARGLTGSLSGSTHITIPATTILLWGNAQLTISDSTTNDAVELGGDGASIYGDQGAGPGLVSRPDNGGYIACGTTGCTTIRNPNAATGNIEWNNIERMSLLATGAGSKVIDLTSIGHAHVEDNRLLLGTGGGSYGIYGNTSTGNHDSTNNLIKHNEINNQSQNDICLYEAGVFNINQLEINVCYLSSQNTGQEGYVFAKDSNGNYPNNVQLYGNDCEQGGSSVSYGVYCYDVQGAQNVTFGPNNRCEHVYACTRFPTDGSAVGIHVIDPYLSLSNSIQLAPNEPAAAMDAVDNNGHNWLPSMHFGFNDLAGPNLLGNAGFEGWQNSTTLYYWGGVSGTNINQAGTNIYAQHAVGTSPADSTTQGSYNLAIGDNATAGLGINSGCIQVDATMEYTLAFRIAAASTGINFRPGVRFYYDANCTEADKITSIATNARVLSPANYAGQSALLGTGSNPNWQSTNASLTYNNGITCNCNVTGFDWQAASANTWTPTRNYAITFRVPNAYSDSTKVAHSMRVFILENTAANPNVIYVDDVVLSQGAVSQNVPLPASLADSGSPTVYGNLAVSGNLSDPNFAAHGVLLGEGSSAVTTATPTGNSQCLMSAPSSYSTTDPSFQTCPGASGVVTSVSGDGVLISNSGSTGTVTLSLGSAAAHKWWGNATGSSGTPSYSSIGTADLPGSGATTVNGTACTLGSSCNLGKLNDTNGNASVQTTTTVSAVDYLNVTNASTGNPATVAAGAAGEDTNVNVNLTSKGSGKVQANGSPVVTGPFSSTNADIASFNGTAGNVIQDSGVPAPALAVYYAQGGTGGTSQGAASANAIEVAAFTLAGALQFSKMVIYIQTSDASNLYSWAITDMSGNAKCHMSAAVSISATGINTQSCAEGTVTLPAGTYCFAFTGNSTTAKIGVDSNSAPMLFANPPTSSSTSGSGVMSFAISIPSKAPTANSWGRPFLVLY